MGLFGNVLLLIMIGTSRVYGAKILFIVSNTNSIVRNYARLATDLSQLGHVTQVLAPSNARVPDFITEAGGNFSYTTYEVDGDQPHANSQEISEGIIQIALSNSSWEKYGLVVSVEKSLMDGWEADCARLVNNKDIMQQIRFGGFQFAILDQTVPHCYNAIPYAMGIPYGAVSNPFLSLVYRVPRLPSFVSPVGYKDRMAFRERLASFVVEMVLQFQLLNQQSIYVDQLAPDRPSVNAMQLIQHNSLWFFLEHAAVGYARPQMPNTAAVGDIAAGRPGKALAKELEEFVSASENGVLVMSFGSYIEHIPHELVRKFCDAFNSERNRLRVVWKMKDVEACPSDGRVKVMRWLPQNDLLADSRVRLLISHGGVNSIVESAYHAKPLIIFPLYYDQPTSAAAAEEKGFAISMNIADFSLELLVSNIDKLLTDPAYKHNAHRVSAILRDQRDTPAQRLSAMIDHVIKYGDRHLRTGAFELSILQFMMFDIFAAVAAMITDVLLVLSLMCCCAYRVCCSYCCKRNKLKTP